MARFSLLSVVVRSWWLIAALLCAAPGGAQEAVTPPTAAPVLVDSLAARHKVRGAEDAYLGGARKLDHNDLAGAEREFAHALQLDPGNPEYVAALAVVREHRLTELVQQAGKARLSGDSARADTLLAEAREIDPENPIVLEHAAPQSPASGTAASQPAPLVDRIRLLSAAENGDALTPNTDAATIAGPIEIEPAPGTKSFHLRGDSQSILRDVAAGFGVRTVFDDSAERKPMRFDLENVTYKEAMTILSSMARVFTVPIDRTSILIAKDDANTRQRLDRVVEETIFLSGLPAEQINDIGNIMRNVFQVRQVLVQQTSQTIVLRASESILGPLNRTIQELVDANGEVMLDVKLYEVDTTRTRNIGATLPTQAGIYSVEAAATSLVNANQTLVQQAVAQGLISSTASNIDIALALIGSGLVQSSLLSSTVGFFGHGLTQTGITASTNTAFNLALNASDTRTLDDVQMQIADRQAATFRAGTRYPITSSTYSTGVSNIPSALNSTKINGVSVASLLSQYTGGGASATVPIVTYEDLGVTLKATPVIQKSGRIHLTIDMKIEALAGGTLDGNPILANRQFTSDISVGDGESAMMVSNLSRTESAAVTGIPGLSELPGFQVPTDKNAEKDSGQLIILVTPHIVRRRSNMISGPRLLIPPQGASASAF